MKDPTASITGQITLDGNPASGLEVKLWHQDYFSRENAVALGKTDSTGRYVFSCLPMGRYWLEVTAPGYFDPFHWNDDGPGRDVSVADGEFVVNADLDLVLGGVITGRVIDPDGHPVVGEFVEVTKIDQLGRPDEPLYLPGEEGDFLTDDNGEYRIYGIPPGRYVVSMGIDVAKVTGVTNRYPLSINSSGRGRVDGDHYFEKMFHPGTNNRSHAAIVDVSTRRIVPNVNIKVGRPIRAYTVTGRVIHDETRIPIRHCYLHLGYYTPTGGCTSSYCMDEESDTDENGNFRVEGLLPGRFFVSAQFQDETELYCTPVDFEIKSADLDGLDVRAHWGQELQGLVVIEGDQTQEAVKRIAQLELHADTRGEGSVGHDSRSCRVKDDGRFVIRGLRPGPVNLSLGFEQTSKYFSIVRIEYSNDAGETVAIFPTGTSRLPSFCPPSPQNALPLLTPTPPNAVPPLPPPFPNALPPANGNALPLLPAPSPAPSRESRRLPPMPSHVPLRPRTTTPLSPELRPLPPAQLNEFLPTVTVAGPQSSHPVPAPIASRQAAPSAGASQLVGPRFPWDLPPLPLSEHGLSGVRLVVSYKNGRIRGHVNLTGENPDHDRPLQAGISHRTERGGRWSTSREIDPNGDFFIDGLAPGEYQISIFSETKTVVVDNDSESRVVFEVDLNSRSNRDYFDSIYR